MEKILGMVCVHRHSVVSGLDTRILSLTCHRKNIGGKIVVLGLWQAPILRSGGFAQINNNNNNNNGCVYTTFRSEDTEVLDAAQED